MGYCNVGVVAEVGAGVTGFAMGDRVASNGKHAEAVSVPANLCALVPDGVADVDAAFTVLGYPAAATKGADAAGQARTVALPAPAKAAVLPAGAPGVSVIGAGNCSSRR